MTGTPTVTPNANTTLDASQGFAATTHVPWEEAHIQVHTILIIIIFCVVCFLLLVAFFYAFCFRCTIENPPKDPSAAHRFSLEREDATFRRSSSDGLSVANVV